MSGIKRGLVLRAVIMVVVFVVGMPLLPMLVSGRWDWPEAWAFIPALVLAAALVVRTNLEDKILREKLPGYEEYTAQVRYRLVPWVW
jgi:protein-S-isoprenylcysteine O-methyltransferase Ste14